MADRPILFSAPMVRALLAGTKTQTRRVVKGLEDADTWCPVGPEVYHPTVVDRHGDDAPGASTYGAGNADGTDWVRCPYGQPGDRLWVRETWQAISGTERARRIIENPRPNFGWVEYASGPHKEGNELPPKWRPSIHMPRWASRITLEVTCVRVERLQDISEADSIAEGIERSGDCNWRDYLDHPYNDFTSARRSYRSLWDQINGTGSWAANPWVWVVSFRRVDA